jgi:hypothetical protein
MDFLIKRANNITKYAIMLTFTICLTTLCKIHAQSNKDTQIYHITIPFTLKEGGYVTLVIDNADGVRVRNLIADTWFDAGKNIVSWDGQDDLGRDIDAAKHGAYSIPGKFVPAGKYTMRGIVHSKINTTYEFSVYATGTPPWSTEDHTGGWLANHTAPQAALFVPENQSPTGKPAIYLGAYVTEGPDGLAWTDLDGKKMGGKKWIGGNWTGAPYLARDTGSKASKDFLAYVAVAWAQGKKKDTLQIRVTGLTKGKDKNIVSYFAGSLAPKAKVEKEIGGLAVFNNMAVVSLTARNEIVVIDLGSGKIIQTINIAAPRGLQFNTTGQLLVLSANKLVRYDAVSTKIKSPVTVVENNLQSPVGFTQDNRGNIYISDGGTSHQVKVFTSAGKFVRAIGNSGSPKAGPYDPLHMNRPAGITIDSNEHLWVAENDYLPKRVSVWSLDGKFIKAFYGPAKYGGGGTLDTKDKTKFYYAEKAKGSMEFELDWQQGNFKLKNILYRRVSGDISIAGTAAPENVIYHNNKRYFTNCYNTSPTNGTATAFLFREKNEQAFPCAAMGVVSDWDELQQEQFSNLLPPLNKKKKRPAAFFIWSDLNGDVKVQANEVSIIAGKASGVTVIDDLSFCLSLKSNAVQFKPTRFTADGVPTYNINDPAVLIKGLSGTISSGGNQTLVTNDGLMITTQGIAPLDGYSISGAKNGKLTWSYPNMWPGLHASHNAPLPDFPGELIGTTRLLGGLLNTHESGRDALWALNSNHGMIYIFTADGLFVTTLFKPMRDGKKWNIPVAKRGMSTDHLTLGEENFWPGITQTQDGKVYVTDGNRSSLIKVDGLQTISRLPEMSINVSTNDLTRISESVNKKTPLQIQAKTPETLSVAINKTKVRVDGEVDEWGKSTWADIDKRGVKAYFNSAAKPYNVTASALVNAGKIYFAFRTGDAELLKNSGDIENALFKTGGGLDIMIGTNLSSKNTRKNAEEGDVRIVVTIVNKKPKALLYRAIVKGTKQADKVPFSSPQRTITFDKVEDISSKIEFAASGSGDYEVSLPLSVINLNAKAGITIKGDLGILRGDGHETISRTYWSNKAAGIVSDVPSEAELTPAQWGTWKFE